ncbi:hypothetical protein C8R43DRAFT_34303 [Mycena crocata]|nr:hypothetical protein C8R43DRAFT_34303 [Mycena crocata]
MSLSPFAKTQDFVCAPAMSGKARPIGFILDRTLAIDHQRGVVNSDPNAVSPDFDPRPISPESHCSETSDDTVASTIVGFGRKRHSVLPTVPRSSEDTTTRSTVVGFGRKFHHHRHSIAVVPTLAVTIDRKHQNRRSLPNPVIVPTNFPVLPARKMERRGSMPVGCLPPLPPMVRAKRPASVLGAVRKVSDSILANHQPPKPLLLPAQVEARELPAVRYKRRLVDRLTSVARLLNRLAGMRLKPLKTGRTGLKGAIKEAIGQKQTTLSLLLRLKDVLFARLRAMMGL